MGKLLTGLFHGGRAHFSGTNLSGKMFEALDMAIRQCRRWSGIFRFGVNFG